MLFSKTPRWFHIETELFVAKPLPSGMGPLWAPLNEAIAYRGIITSHFKIRRKKKGRGEVNKAVINSDWLGKSVGGEGNSKLPAFEYSPLSTTPPPLPCLITTPLRHPSPHSSLPYTQPEPSSWFIRSLEHLLKSPWPLLSFTPNHHTLINFFERFDKLIANEAHSAYKWIRMSKRFLSLQSIYCLLEDTMIYISWWNFHISSLDNG